MELVEWSAVLVTVVCIVWRYYRMMWCIYDSGAGWRTVEVVRVVLCAVRQCCGNQELNFFGSVHPINYVRLHEVA